MGPGKASKSHTSAERRGTKSGLPPLSHWDGFKGVGGVEEEKEAGHEEAYLATYGVTEFRDGFFDALFSATQAADSDYAAEQAEPSPSQGISPSSQRTLATFAHKQWREIQAVMRRLATTRSGIKLLKDFLAFFIAYIPCLVPVTRDWLGLSAGYLIAVSTIFNHPSRTLGAQIDGVILTIIGAATGLGWGAFGLWLSTASSDARAGFGGVLAMCLCVFMAAIAFVRSYYVRFYQATLAAGIAVAYTCLSEVNGQAASWLKLRDFAVPWVLGQSITLVISTFIFPDAGARPLAVALHDCFQVMLGGLDIPSSPGARGWLSLAFVGLSQAYRDLAIDLSVTRFYPRDVLELRNLMQNVIRAFLALETDVWVFDVGDSSSTTNGNAEGMDSGSINTAVPAETDRVAEHRAVQLVREHLEEPLKGLLRSMTLALQSCDALLVDISGYRSSLGPAESVSSDVLSPLLGLRQMMDKFDTAEKDLLEGGGLPAAASSLPGVVRILAFCRPLRQAAAAMEALAARVSQLGQSSPKFPHISLPSYPWRKALEQNNAQVRHDRGGVTAGSFYRSFRDISDLIQETNSRGYVPPPHEDESDEARPKVAPATMSAADLDEDHKTKKQKFRYRLWKTLHRLQGYETRYALKTAIVTTLLSVGAWLPQSRGWWNQYQAWWVVVTAWLMMHPRVGGNFQDLLTHSAIAAFGALWSGISYAVGNGNPYAMAVFAAIYMLPMLYRFTQSPHARSGAVGCQSFIVISLALVKAGSGSPSALSLVFRGLVFIVGVVAAVIINWLLWPFVARHELRKALSNMQFFLSIMYRSTVAKYIYYEQGHEPSPEDMHRSELLESRLREGFVRMRQLLALSAHEPRLRAPFQPAPYAALTNACERFLDHLVAVRQASRFFHPRFLAAAAADDSAAGLLLLLAPRRDAVAAVLSTLYVLAGALRSGRSLPRYLPSAAAARRRLLAEMARLERRLAAGGAGAGAGEEQVRWVRVYSYSYNRSLTGCTVQLEQLERLTKMIVGEQGMDTDEDTESNSDSGSE